MKQIEVKKDILRAHETIAQENRKLFKEKGTFVFNLMSSPGSGKTALLEALADVAGFNFGVVEGDLETSRDADRLKSKGIEDEEDIKERKEFLRKIGYKLG